MASLIVVTRGLTTFPPDEILQAPQNTQLDGSGFEWVWSNLRVFLYIFPIPQAKSRRGRDLVLTLYLPFSSDAEARVSHAKGDI